MKISTKIFSMLLMVLAISFSFSGWMMIQQERRVLNRLLEDRGQDVAHTVAVFSIELLMSEDYPLLNSFIETTGKERDDIISIEVIHNDNLVSQYAAQKAPNSSKVSFTADIVFMSKNDHPPLKLGYVRVTLSDEENKTIIAKRIRNLIWGTLFIFCLLFLTLLLIMKKTILVKIDSLSRHVKLIEEGDLKQQIDLKSNDELGELAAAFNNMVAELSIVNDKLRKKIEDHKAAEGALQHNLERLSKINECFLNFSPDSSDNINRLTALCGELLGGTCALYNRLDQGLLYSWGQWNTPPGYNPIDRFEGHICYDVIKKASGKVLVVSNLQQTHYALTDPNVARYKLETYIGQAVKFGESYVGSLCVVFQHEFVPSERDKMVFGIIASAIGVEEVRKWAEEALRKSEHRLNILFESAPDAYYICDYNGVFADGNKAAEKLVGYSRETLAGKNFADAGLLSMDETEKVVKLFSKSIKGKATGPDDFTLKRKDGTRVNVEILAHPVKIDNKEMILCIARDITKRKQAKAALRESEEKYRILVENANDAIFIAQDGMVKFLNRRTEDLTGYAAKELMSRPFVEFIHQQDRDMVIDRHKRRLNGEAPINTYVFKIINKSGTELIVQLNTALVKWEGRPATLNFLKDITQQTELESRLQQSQKMEAIGTLAGGIAHDFNNVLYGMMGYTDLARDLVPEGSKAQQHLQQVLKGAERAKEMVQQILSFSRQSKKEKNPINIQSVLKEAVKLLRTSLPSTIEIHQNIDPDCGLVMSDPTQIHQTIMNLATNAYHAMREKGGVLDITLMQEEISTNGPKFNMDLHPGSYIKLMVEDTGHGIDGLVINKIFDPYFTTKGVGEGTGMGLAVVYGIVKEHGGDISVQSEPGKGTAVHVYLPLIEAAIFERENISEKEQVPTGTERILFVDDEEIIVHLAEEMLAPLGYHVTSRTSSVEALGVFRAKPDEFDLIITDMTMPNMTGAELSYKLREIRPDIPIILCTGFSELIDKNRAKAIGIRQYVMKPILKMEIAQAIRKAMEKPNTD